jgi:hypothetical protein
MIDADLRRAVLANFPPGTSLVVVAPPDKGYVALLESRGDGLRFLGIDGQLPAPGSLGAIEHVLLEGVDDIEDPAALLAAVRVAAPVARLFMLVSNAAYLRGLLAFFNGAPLAREHPLVEAEIPPLLGAGGWKPVAITPIPDESISGPGSLPFELASPTICFKISDPAMLHRACVRAFIAIADRV